MKTVNLTTTDVDKILIPPAKDILEKLGIDKNDAEYAQALYNLRYAMYRAVAETFNLKTK